MNLYKPPASDLEPKEKLSLRVTTSIAIAILSIPAIYIAVFPIVEIVKDIISGVGIISSFKERIVADSILTFIFLITYFSLIFRLRPHHAKYICIFCGVAMFLYWGYESSFFWNGFNPMFPVWYEVNMAINDLVAALLVIFWNNSITSKASINETSEVA